MGQWSEFGVLRTKIRDVWLMGVVFFVTELSRGGRWCGGIPTTGSIVGLKRRGVWMGKEYLLEAMWYTLEFHGQQHVFRDHDPLSQNLSHGPCDNLAAAINDSPPGSLPFPILYGSSNALRQVLVYTQHIACISLLCIEDADQCEYGDFSVNKSENSVEQNIEMYYILESQGLGGQLLATEWLVIGLEGTRFFRLFVLCVRGIQDVKKDKSLMPLMFTFVDHEWNVEIVGRALDLLWNNSHDESCWNVWKIQVERYPMQLFVCRFSKRRRLKECIGVENRLHWHRISVYFQVYDSGSHQWGKCQVMDILQVPCGCRIVCNNVWCEQCSSFAKHHTIHTDEKYVLRW